MGPVQAITTGPVGAVIPRCPNLKLRRWEGRAYRNDELGNLGLDAGYETSLDDAQGAAITRRRVEGFPIE